MGKKALKGKKALLRRQLAEIGALHTADQLRTAVVKIVIIARQLQGRAVDIHGRQQDIFIILAQMQGFYLFELLNNGLELYGIAVALHGALLISIICVTIFYCTMSRKNGKEKMRGDSVSRRGFFLIFGKSVNFSLAIMETVCYYIWAVDSAN